ncbi:MAG: hypothetical protein ACKV2T_42030 [Kofleriaceae bacterium]
MIATRRAAALVLVASLCLAACGFAKKHPAITIGITSGLIAEGTCELATGEHLTCLGISTGIGIVLAGIVAIAMVLGGEGDTILGGNDPDAPPPPEVPQDPTLDEPLDPEPVKVPPVVPASELAPPSPSATSSAP